MLHNATDFIINALILWMRFTVCNWNKLENPNKVWKMSGRSENFNYNPLVFHAFFLIIVFAEFRAISLFRKQMTSHYFFIANASKQVHTMTLQILHIQRRYNFANILFLRLLIKLLNFFRSSRNKKSYYFHTSDFKAQKFIKKLAKASK
jgi:hypothetical protein